MHNLLLLTNEQFYGADSALVYLNLRADVGEEFPVVYLNLSVSSQEEHTTYDATTVYLDLSVLGGECFSTYSGTFLGEGEAELRWYEAVVETRWSGDDALRWSLGDAIVDGINC